MKVFVAESGSGSSVVARELHAVLPLTVHGVETFLATTDLPKGVPWSSELLQRLDDADAGIFCVTPEALRNGWFNFEGGVIFNRNRQRLVCAYVVSGKVPPSSPFSLFQLTQATEDETFQLFRQLNDALDKRMQPDQLRRAFEAFWPALEGAIAKARNGNGRA